MHGVANIHFVTGRTWISDNCGVRYGRNAAEMHRGAPRQTELDRELSRNEVRVCVEVVVAIRRVAPWRLKSCHKMNSSLRIVLVEIHVRSLASVQANHFAAGVLISRNMRVSYHRPMLHTHAHTAVRPYLQR